VLARLLDGSPRRNLSALLTKQLDTPIETEQAGVQTVPVCTYGYIYVWSLAALSVSVYLVCLSNSFLKTVLNWFYDIFIGAATEATCCGSFVAKGFSLLVVSY
jgi:hypothetical protein